MDLSILRACYIMKYDVTSTDNPALQLQTGIIQVHAWNNSTLKTISYSFDISNRKQYCLAAEIELNITIQRHFFLSILGY